MYKNILFNDELRAEIQAYADRHFNGNYTMAVVFLCRTALDNFTTNRDIEK